MTSALICFLTLALCGRFLVLAPLQQVSSTAVPVGSSEPSELSARRGDVAAVSDELDWARTHQLNLVRGGWRKVPLSLADPSSSSPAGGAPTLLSLRFFLRLNTDALAEKLEEVSHPRSPSYGHYYYDKQGFRDFLDAVHPALPLRRRTLETFLRAELGATSVDWALDGDSVSASVAAHKAAREFGLDLAYYRRPLQPHHGRASRGALVSEEQVIASSTPPQLNPSIGAILSYVKGLELPYRQGSMRGLPSMRVADSSDSESDLRDSLNSFKLTPRRTRLDGVSKIGRDGVFKRAPRSNLPRSSSPNPNPANSTPQHGAPGPPPGAPLPNSGEAGNGTLYILLLPTCQDGSFTQNMSHPCAASPPQLSAYDVMLTQGGLNTTHRVAAQDTICSPSAYFPGMFCSVIVGGVVDGQMMDVYARSAFVDGFVSEWVYYQQVMPTVLVDPAMLRRLYHVPDDQLATGASQGMVQFMNASFSMSDLYDFLGRYDLPTPENVVVHGLNRPAYVNVEPQLDIQMLSAMGRGADTWAWITPYNGDFLQWAVDVNTATEHPLVFSLSYGAPENGYPAQWKHQLDAELLKLGLKGVTVAAATGDDGNQSTAGSETCKTLTVSVLAGSPWITAVGGTTLALNGSQVGVQVDAGMYYTAGGGFSQFRGRPSYQNASVEGFLASSPYLPPPSVFNASGRALPDVSAVALNEVIVNRGGLELSGGTSTATPIFAGLVTTLNSVLQRRGGTQKSMGFVNHFLYENANSPGAFYDVEVGDSRCSEWENCCEWGFFAQKGWDPVSGVGTPHFLELSALLPQAEQRPAKPSAST